MTTANTTTGSIWEDRARYSEDRGWPNDAKMWRSAGEQIAALEARCRELEADLAEETEAHDAWKKLCIEKEQRIAEIEKTGEDFFCRVAAGYPHVLAENQDVAQPFRICLGASTPETFAEPADLMVNPQPTWIESSGRWKYPLKPPHDNDGKCPAVYTASREWWEYLPAGAFPPGCNMAAQKPDGRWFWCAAYEANRRDE